MKRILAAAFTTFLLTFSAPVWASGPDATQPSTVTLSQREVRYVAHRGTQLFLSFLPRPRTSKVERCVGGPSLWSCPLTVHSDGISCSARIAIWADEATYYFELHGLRCVETS